MTEKVPPASPPGEPRLEVLADPDAVAEAGAERVVATLGAALVARGVAHLALTGGSSAVPLYERLASAPLRGALDWGAVHLWWGDERYVPRDHPDSNAGLADAILLAAAARSGEAHDGAAGTDVEAGLRAGIDIPVDHVHPWPTDRAIGHGLGPAEAATAYATELRAGLPFDRAGRPIFDLVLLGVGLDGHILSVFPGSPALAADAPLTLAVPAPTHIAPHVPRMTIAARVLEAARGILVMASGAPKASVLCAVLEGPRDVSRLPAQAARLPTASWLLDRAAAAELTP